MPDFSSLPSVTALASIPELAGHEFIVRVVAAQSALEQARKILRQGKMADVNQLATNAAKALVSGSLRSVYNFSGVILHTGLGRAPIESGTLGDAYCNLEFDMASGKRGDRQDHIRSLLCDLTGSEDAMVVNNGAAAVFLTLTALCKGKQVLLSRGQSVEIGGSFRMPEIIKSSGCKLVDVGTTNKCYVSDYVEAVTAQSAAILRCHPSNYEVSGFVSEPSLSDLARAAHDQNLLMINDQGNGAMIDFGSYGISGIEIMPASVAGGADITIGSGDKLLGGPQCGIILGRKDLITKIKKHPMARVVRIDKNSLLTLQSVLISYRTEAYQNIPILEILSIPAVTVKQWCETLAPEGTQIKESLCELGSGSGSGKGVASYSVVLPSRKPDQLLRALRDQNIVGRIEKDAVWLDPRCVQSIHRSWDPHKNESPLMNGLKYCLTECWNKWK